MGHGNVSVLPNAIFWEGGLHEATKSSFMEFFEKRKLQGTGYIRAYCNPFRRQAGFPVF